MNSGIVLALVVLVVGFAALSAQARVDIAGPLRNWFNARDARRLARRRPLPETVERTYWTLWEYRHDAPRYTTLGYRIDSENLSNPRVVDPVVAQLYNAPRIGAFGRGRGQPPSRRIPVAYVIYSLRAPGRDGADPWHRAGAAASRPSASFGSESEPT